ncbi:MAG: N-acetylmuramoyl-L-alanine amidase [Saprospiraceae bacterium]|nr:N-acetylmuramoyl-L-alanine amidase [Saprospiraceae bacterium]
MRFWIGLLLVSICVAFSSDKGPTYHKATARNGDGAYSLLRRYQLIDHISNLYKFYELNALDHNAHLEKGQTYLLPVLIYQYNGQSIRSTIGIDDWDMANRIARYNRDLTRAGLREGDYEETGILWVPMHEMVNHEPVTAVEEIPAIATTVALTHDEPAEVLAETTPAPEPTAKLDEPVPLSYPLFGPDHAEITHVSNQLQGQVFYLVSGHGGPDPGAISEYIGESLCEDEYAYDVTLRLARKLMEHGAIVEVIIQDPNDGIRSESILECDKEELCMGKPIPIWQTARLQQRTHAINELHRTYREKGIDQHTVVCIHVDSRSPQRRQDVFFYYYPHSKSGRSLALQLQKVFKEKYRKNRPGRDYRGTVSSRDLYVLKYTDPTAVYVELANIRNAADRYRILPESNRQALANWLFEGLIR